MTLALTGEEKLREAQEDLTSLSPHDSLLNRSETKLSMPASRKSDLPTIAHPGTVRHTRMLSEPPTMGATNHPFSVDLGRASLVKNTAPIGTSGWERGERMSCALGRPLDTRRPTLPMI
jgi:hypothetical protein